MSDWMIWSKQVINDVNQVHIKRLEKLPKGWAEKTVSEVVKMISTNGKKLPQKAYMKTATHPIIDQGKQYIGGYHDNTELLVEEEPPFIIFGDHSRSFKFANFKFIPGADGIKVMRPIGIDSKWAFYIFQAIRLPNKGYARHFQYLKEAYLPVPPLEQQKRIVAKIEKLFSHIDAGIAALNQAKQLLKRYRQSILKAAVTGELTKQWRKENKDKLEPASQLLKRILAERREKWEQQQLQKFKAKGKMPKNDKWKEKYKEPEYADLINEIDLPGWLEIPFEIVGQNLDGKRIPLSKKIRKTFKGKYPYYGACDIIDYVPEYLFEGQHLLIGEDGANLLSKSKPLAFVVNGQFWVNNHAHIIKCFDFILPEYIAYHIDSMDISPWVSGSAQPKLNQKNLNKISIKLPSTLEQKVIIDKINKRCDASHRLAKELESQLIKAEKNKQSILASAFSGKLEN